MQNLLIMLFGAMMALIPNYLFKMLVLAKPTLAPELFIKKLYYAQIFKMLLIIILLTIGYISFQADAKWLAVSFILTYITDRVVTSYRCSNK